MFVFLFEMRYFNKFFKIDDFVDKVLHADISDVIPCHFVFVDLSLVLRVRAVTNRFLVPLHHAHEIGRA